jgi:hypothetical protein
VVWLTTFNFCSPRPDFFFGGGCLAVANISALDLGREYMPVNADKLFGDASRCGHLTEAREICSGSVKNS